MSKKLRNTLGAVALGAAVAQSPDVQAHTNLSVEQYRQELAKILAGWSVENGKSAAHVGGVLTTSENSAIAGSVQNGNKKAITLAAGTAGEKVYAGVAVSGAKQDGIKAGKVSAIAGVTNGDVGANVQVSSERAKSRDLGSMTSQNTRTWKEETNEEIRNYTETTTRTDSFRQKGHSINKVELNVTKKITNDLQALAGVVHTTGNLPKGYKKVAGQAGVKFRGDNASLQATADTNQNVDVRANYQFDNNWWVYAGAEYQKKSNNNKNVYAGVEYNFGAGHQGTKSTTPTLDKFSARSEMKDFVTNLPKHTVGNVQRLVENQVTSTLNIQKDVKITKKEKPPVVVPPVVVPPVTPPVEKEVEKVPNNYPTVDLPTAKVEVKVPDYAPTVEVDTYVPPEILPPPEIDAKDKNIRIILPEGVEFDGKILRNGYTRTEGTTTAHGGGKSRWSLLLHYNPEGRYIRVMTMGLIDPQGDVDIPLRLLDGTKLVITIPFLNLGYSPFEVEDFGMPPINSEDDAVYTLQTRPRTTQSQPKNP